MRVLITGGAGFIGGHAVKHFVDCGDEVMNVDKLTYASKSQNLSLSKFTKLDICDREAFEKLITDFRPDYVVNFAAETHVDNSILSHEEFVQSNVVGTSSVLSVCNKLKVKLCHISTDEVYGPAGSIPFNEEDRLNPMNPYSATKAAGDLLIKSFHNTHKTPYVIVRPSNNYGPQQHEEKFIPKLLKCIESGEKFPLYGDGSQVREWTYVKDTVSVIRKILATEKSWCSTYNLTSQVSMSNVEVIENVLRTHSIKTGIELDLEDIVRRVEDRKGHDKKYHIDSTKLNAIVPHTYKSFDEGIREIIDGQ